MKAPLTKILVLFAVAISLPEARADVLLFKNGDRLSGTLVEQTKDSIRFQSPSLGLIVVPADQAQIETTTARETVASSNPAEKTPAPAASGWGDRVKKLINSVTPGDVTGRFDAGVNNTRATSVTTQINTSGNLTLKNGVNTYEAKAFYYYTATRDQNGVVNRSADRYGSAINYRRDLDERLFINNEASYLRDFQANINQQAQDTFTSGYTIWKSGAVNLAFEAGPTERYSDAEGIANKWFTLGTGKQTLRWQISDALRLEQDSTASAQPNDLNSYTWKVSTALINKIDRNLELSLRFSQSYNTLVGLKGSRDEQLLALALGLTF